MEDEDDIDEEREDDAPEPEAWEMAYLLRGMSPPLNYGGEW